MQDHKSFWDRHSLVLHVGIGMLLTFFCILLPVLLWTHATVDRSLMQAERSRMGKLHRDWIRSLNGKMEDASGGSVRLAGLLAVRPSAAMSASEFSRIAERDEAGVWRSSGAGAAFAVPSAGLADGAARARVAQMKTVLECFGAGAKKGAVCGIWAVPASGGLVVFRDGAAGLSARLDPVRDRRASEWAPLVRPEVNPRGLPVWTVPRREAGDGGWMVSVVVPCFVEGRWAGAVGTDICISDLCPVGGPFSGVPDSHFFLLQADGVILASNFPGLKEPAGLAGISDPVLRDRIQKELPVWLDGRQAATPVFREAGDEYVTGFRCGPAGWVAAGVFPKHAMQSVTHEPFRQLMWNVLLALLVVFGMSLFLITRHNINRRHEEAALARRLARQRLVSSIAHRLLHVDAEKIDAQITQSLMELGETMEADHLLLSQAMHEGARLALSPLSAWHAEGAPPTDYAGLLPLERWMWLRQVVTDGRTETAESLGALPPAAAAEAAEWARAGIRSFAGVTVKGKRMTVFFWFLSMRKPKTWDPEEVQMLKLGCGIVLSALENKFAEIKIRQSEERFRVALQDSPVSVFSQDASLRYSWVYNPPAWMNAVSLIGQADADFYPPDVAMRLTALKREVLAGGGTRREEVTVTAAPDKVLTYDVTMEPLYDLAGRIAGITSATVDISATKRAAEERLLLEGSVREAQKLECLAAMAGGVAHDFNNLLMVILGNAELAQRSKAGSRELAECLEAITSAGQRASELSRMMLIYSGRSSANPRPVILGELLTGMRNLVESLVPKNIMLDYQPAGNDLQADMDPCQIQQLVTNLVTNAVEAVSDCRGEIRVSSGSRMMSRQNFQSAPAGLGQNRPDGLYAFIEVSDTGCGMDEESRRHLFEPFFSTKFAGRGLGLSVVFGITRAHGGVVTVDSHAGSGTRVTVYFPARQRPVAAPPEPLLEPPAEGEADRSKKNLETLGTILVVDDEDCIRDLVQHVLEMAGYSVLPAGDGVIGLSLFHQKPDLISAAILDLKMPRMDGYELIRSLHRVRPDLPIIVFSGYSEEDATGNLAGHEIAAFLQKPCETQTLLRTVKSVLSRPAVNDPLFLL